jgi:hypothetical protein
VVDVSIAPRSWGRHPVIAERDKVIQVCTAQALPAASSMTRSRPISPHVTHVKSHRDWVSRGSFAVAMRRNTLCDHGRRPHGQRLPSRAARTAASLMSLRFVAVSTVSRP